MRSFKEFLYESEEDHEKNFHYHDTQRNVHKGGIVSLGSGRLKGPVKDYEKSKKLAQHHYNAHYKKTGQKLTSKHGFKDYKLEEEMTAGSGAVAGIGIGSQGEPGGRRGPLIKRRNPNKM